MSTFSKNIFDLLNEDGSKPAAPVAAPAKDTKDAQPAPAKDTRGKANGAPRGGRRGGRQQNRRGREFDRHSGTGLVDSEKKVKQSWGHAETAEAEAAKDTLSPNDPAAEQAAAEAAEAEEKVKTLEEYLVEKANKALNVSLPEARKANEGADDKWDNAVAFVKEEEPEFFAASKEAKPAKKAAEKQRKVVVEIEQRFVEKTRGGFRGGRGAGGDRRGGDRRGRGNGRRGPKAAAAPAVNIQDASAFPSLGATA